MLRGSYPFGGFPGFRNLTGTGFINAACQCLCHVPALREHLLANMPELHLHVSPALREVCQHLGVSAEAALNDFFDTRVSLQTLVAAYVKNDMSIMSPYDAAMKIIRGCSGGEGTYDWRKGVEFDWRKGADVVHYVLLACGLLSATTTGSDGAAGSSGNSHAKTAYFRRVETPKPRGAECALQTLSEILLGALPEAVVANPQAEVLVIAFDAVDKDSDEEGEDMKKKRAKRINVGLGGALSVGNSKYVVRACLQSCWDTAKPTAMFEEHGTAFFKENGRWYYANDTFVEVVPRPAELPDVLFLEKAAWSEEGLRPAEEASYNHGDAFTIQILQGYPHWQFEAVALRQLTG